MFINGKQHYGAQYPFARAPLKLEPLMGGMLLRQRSPPYSAFRFRASRRFQKSVLYFSIMLWHTSRPVLAWHWAPPGMRSKGDGSVLGFENPVQLSSRPIQVPLAHPGKMRCLAA